VAFVLSLPLLPVDDDYWRHTGELRRSVLEAGFKAKLADALIAQVCIDNDVPLITYDADFRHFTRWSEARVAARFCIQTMIP